MNRIAIALLVILGLCLSACEYAGESTANAVAVEPTRTRTRTVTPGPTEQYAVVLQAQATINTYATNSQATAAVQTASAYGLTATAIKRSDLATQEAQQRIEQTRQAGFLTATQAAWTVTVAAAAAASTSTAIARATDDANTQDTINIQKTADQARVNAYIVQQSVKSDIDRATGVAQAILPVALIAGAAIVLLAALIVLIVRAYRDPNKLTRDERGLLPVVEVTDRGRITGYYDPERNPSATANIGPAGVPAIPETVSPEQERTTARAQTIEVLSAGLSGQPRPTAPRMQPPAGITAPGAGQHGQALPQIQIVDAKALPWLPEVQERLAMDVESQDQEGGVS